MSFARRAAGSSVEGDGAALKASGSIELLGTCGPRTAVFDGYEKS